MPPPENAVTSDGRLRGLDICNYMEEFTDKFLIAKAKFHFETEILNIERDRNGNWNVAVEDLATRSLRTLTFSRIILATGVSGTNFETIYLQSESFHHEGM
jgi:dimethylaniline monooxygenase (N-oxide forming)